MSTDIDDYIVNSRKMEWQPLIQKGSTIKGFS